jgi:hypothetical protein
MSVGEEWAVHRSIHQSVASIHPNQSTNRPNPSASPTSTQQLTMKVVVLGPKSSKKNDMALGVSV